MKRACLRRPWTFISVRECFFFPPVNSVSRSQAAFEWGSVSCCHRIFIVKKMTESSAIDSEFFIYLFIFIYFILFFYFLRKTRLLWFAKLLSLLISGDIAPKILNQVRCSSRSVIFLTMKIFKYNFLFWFLLIKLKQFSWGPRLFFAPGPLVT